MMNEGIAFQKDIERQLRKKEHEFTRLRLKEEKKSIEEHKQKGINISSIVLDLLEDLGFERKDRGTIYLEDVISTLYHERKAFQNNNDYFDFDNRRNNHYVFTKELYECGLKTIFESIDKSVEKSYVNESSLNDIIYDVTNDVISQYDRCGKKLVYKKGK